MGINFGRIAQGLATGYLGAAIKDKESKDNARLEVVKAAGIDYYTNQLPAHKKSEENRASAYKQLTTILGSEEAVDFLDANGILVGDGKDVERVQKMLEDKNIKPDAFKDYVPTSNYSDRYKQRQTDFESRFDVVKKTFDMQGSGIGPSTINGLLTKPEGAMTTTEEVTTPAVEPQDMGPTEKGFMTEGTPEKTETITTEIPRTTADTAMSEFFISKTGVLDIGKTSDIEKAAANFRGFGEGMTTDALGNTTLNIMGNKAVELAAFKSVMNDVAKQYVTEDDKVSLSLTAEAANKKLFDQTQGVIGMDNVSMVEGYNKGTVKGAESYTATGFSADFENSFEGNTKREKILRYISTLGTKSEAQYFAQSFPSNLTFDDGVNIKQFLLTVTQ
jgi:hypothetical protein